MERLKPAPIDFTTRALRSPLGDLVLRPWFDWFGLEGIVRGFLPLSRAWAEAVAAAGNVDCFAHYPPVVGRSSKALQRVLSQIERLRASHASADQEWRRIFLENGKSAAAKGATVEAVRHRAAHRLMMGRGLLVPWLSRFEPVKWALASPREVERLHGDRLARPVQAFAVTDRPEAQETAGYERGALRQHWLYFDSPALGDRAWARVESPGAVKDPPTFIFLHGITMETELWRGTGDTLIAGLGNRYRIIRPEGPWHGRRQVTGWYGGEPAIAKGPLGMLDLFHGWIRELAVIIDWARQSSKGPVILGGVSLGALTSQLTAAVARDWPEHLRPDALFLTSTSGAVVAMAGESALTRGIGLARRLSAQGWSDTDLERWAPLMAPLGSPSVPPERIVMLLGERDQITSTRGGLALAKAWDLPKANLFTRPQGHFSVSLGLMRDPAPLRRLDEIVRALDEGR